MLPPTPDMSTLLPPPELSVVGNLGEFGLDVDVAIIGIFETDI